LKRGFGVADEQYQDVILHRLKVPAERRGGMLSRFGRTDSGITRCSRTKRGCIANTSPGSHIATWSTSTISS